METISQEMSASVNSAQEATSSPQRSALRNFRLNIEKAEAEWLLAQAYRSLVERYGGTLQVTDDVRNRLSVVAKWLTDETMPPFLLLFGNLGNGKTTTAKAVGMVMKYVWKNVQSAVETRGMCNTRSNPDPEWAWAWNKLYLTPKPDFYAAEDIVRATREDDTFMLTTARDTSFLILDDAGRESHVVKVYGTNVTPIEDIFYSRYEKRRMTLITTNLQASQFGEIYGERVADRLREIAMSVYCTDTSFRRKYSGL